MKLLSDEYILDFGIFDSRRVSALVKKMQEGKVSEIDNMAFIGILSLQLLHDLFINRSYDDLEDRDLIDIDKIILE